MHFVIFGAALPCSKNTSLWTASASLWHGSVSAVWAVWASQWVWASTCEPRRNGRKVTDETVYSLQCLNVFDVFEGEPSSSFCSWDRKSDSKSREGFPYSSARRSLALCNLGGHAGGQGTWEKIHHQGRVSLESTRFKLFHALSMMEISVWVCGVSPGSRGVQIGMTGQARHAEDTWLYRTDPVDFLCELHELPLSGIAACCISFLVIHCLVFACLSLLILIKLSAFMHPEDWHCFDRWW